MKDGKAAVKFKGALENSLNKERLRFEKAQSMFRETRIQGVCMFICNKWAESQSIMGDKVQKVSCDQIEEGFEFQAKGFENTSKAFLTREMTRPKLCLKKGRLMLVFKICLQRELLEGGGAFRKLWRM